MALLSYTKQPLPSRLELITFQTFQNENRFCNDYFFDRESNV